VLQSIWRYSWAVLAVTVLAGLIGFGLSQLQAVRYEATGELLITDPRDAGVFGAVRPQIDSADRYVRNEAQRVMSSTVAVRVSERLEGAMTPAEVRRRIMAVAASDLDLITVTAEGDTAEEAATLANTVMEVYEELIRAEVRTQAESSIAELQSTQTELQARVNEIEDVLTGSSDDVALLERDAAVEQLIANQQLMERIRVDAALYGSGVELLEPAQPPASPVAPRTTANALLAAMLGFAGAAVIAVWRTQTQQRADRRHEPAAILDVPLLGAVPDLGDVSRADTYPTVAAPESPAAEAFRFAVAALEHTLEPTMRTIVVTSPQAGDGKTMAVLNLGVVLAQENRRVLVADADLRMRGLSKLTGVPTRPGLTDLVDESQPLDSAVHTWKPAWWLRLPISPVGGREVNPTAFFRTAPYRTALNRLQEAADLLIIDAPPLLAASDASAIAGSADAVILVVNSGTPLPVLADLQERLTFVGTPVLGYIFNRATDKRGSSYGYAQGYPVTRHAGWAAPAASQSAAANRPTSAPPPPIDEPARGPAGEPLPRQRSR
jgi:Mrp family chromosome partitioning ATPase/capsular polysaccharide biosynthesis protein